VGIFLRILGNTAPVERTRLEKSSAPSLGADSSQGRTALGYPRLNWRIFWPSQERDILKPGPPLQRVPVQTLSRWIHQGRRRGRKRPFPASRRDEKIRQRLGGSGLGRPPGKNLAKGGLLAGPRLDSTSRFPGANAAPRSAITTNSELRISIGLVEDPGESDSPISEIQGGWRAFEGMCLEGGGPTGYFHIWPPRGGDYLVCQP